MRFQDLPSGVQDALTEHANTKKCSICRRPRPSVAYYGKTSHYRDLVITFHCRGPRIAFTRDDGEEHHRA